MSKRVLCLLTDGFEEIETVTPVDLLRRAGVEIVMAALGGNLQLTGRSGITLHADALLKDVNEADFDLLFIPGGPAVKALREDGRPSGLAKSFVSCGRPVAAICAAPLVLLDAGLLEGKRYTAHHSTYQELAEAKADLPVVTDGLIITSRGAGTALSFGLELIKHLSGEDEALKVSQSIMVD